MPSTTSSSVSIVFDSSTVMTPSLPTLSIASAMIVPIVLSPFAETVPTWAIIVARDRLGQFVRSPRRPGCDRLFDAALEGHRVRTRGNRA